MPDQRNPYAGWAALLNRHMREGKGRAHHFPRTGDREWTPAEFRDRFSELRGDDRPLNRKTLDDWCAGRSIPKGVNRATLSRLFWPARLAETAEERRAWAQAFADAEPPKRRRLPPSPEPQPKNRRGGVPLADIVGGVSAAKRREMAALDDEIRRGGYVTTAGALTDPFAVGSTDGDAIEDLQALAAVDLADGVVAWDQVGDLERLLDRCQTGGSDDPPDDGADRRLQPSFIASVIAGMDSDPGLSRMSASLKDQGRFAEHRMIECVLSHGRSAMDTRSALAELKRFRGANAGDAEVTSFLNYRLAIGYRKLGLHAQAAFVGAEVRAADSSSGRYQSIVLNLRHLDVPQRLYGAEGFRAELAADTARLARSFEDMTGVAADAVTAARVGEAADLSILASALLGMLQSRTVIGAATESDALAALAAVEEYGRSVQTVARASGFEEVGASLFKHAYWELARIAPFALLNGWVEVFDRLAATFIRGFHSGDTAFDDAHRRFLATQLGPRADPNHVQIVMAMAVRREMAGGEGGEVLDRLLPDGVPAPVVHNVIIGRAWAGLQSAIGRPLSTTLPTHTLPRMEARLMLDCVAMLQPT